MSEEKCNIFSKSDFFLNDLFDLDNIDFFLDNSVYFNPQSLKNLEKLEEIESLGFISEIIAEDFLNEDCNQIYALSSKGKRSSISMLKSKIKISEVLKISIDRALALWTLPFKFKSNSDELLILSFENETKVMKIGEKIEEFKNNFFDTKNPTIHIDILFNDSFIQIINSGMINIVQSETGFKKTLYSISSSKDTAILNATSNGLQIVINLKRELIYFELDRLNNKLVKIETDASKLFYEIYCLSIPSLNTRFEKSKFLAVGCSDSYVRIISLEHTSCLVKISSFLSTSIFSVLFMNNPLFNKKDNNFCLYIGGLDGILNVCNVDFITGNILDVKPYKISEEKNQNEVNIYKLNETTIFVESAKKNIIFYNHLNKNYEASLDINHKIRFVSSFKSTDLYLSGIILFDNYFQIFSINSFDLVNSIHIHKNIPLRYTPKKVCFNKDYNSIYILQSDINVLNEKLKQDLKNELKDDQDNKNTDLKESEVGVPITINDFNDSSPFNIMSNDIISNSNLKIHCHSYASCLLILNSRDLSQISLYEIENNEYCLSMSVLNFSKYEETFLIVSSVKDYQMSPKSFTSSGLMTFCIKKDGLEFISKVSL